MRDLDRDALDRRGHELLRRHLEAAVTVDRPHGAVGPTDLGADRGGTENPIVPRPPELTQVYGSLKLPVLRRPHLVLADAGREDRALGRRVAQLLEAELRLQRGTRLARLVGQRELLAAIREMRSSTPTCRPASTPLSLQVADRLDQLLDDEPAVADDRDVGPAHLALLGRDRCRRG